METSWCGHNENEDSTLPGRVCPLSYVCLFVAWLSRHAQATGLSPSPSVPLIMVVFSLPVTYLGHFGDRCLVGPIQEPWLVVVDVLDLDDELGLGLQGSVRQAVAGLCSEDVLGLHLPIQPLDGVNVPRAVVDGEGGACAFTCQDVLNGAVAFVHV